MIQRCCLMPNQGVTQFVLVTLNIGLKDPQAHIDAIKKARDTLGGFF